MSNPQFVLLYLLIINILSFVIYGIDKFKAKRESSRVPEKYLLLIAIIGGSVGAWSSIYFFHHKTKHLKFVIGLPLIFLIHFIVAFYVLNIIK